MKDKNYKSRRSILVHCDPDFHAKLNSHKTELENKLGNSLSWESYLKHLFFREAAA